MSVEHSTQFCADCTVRHIEEGMTRCEDCGQWSCKPRPDEDYELCAECYDHAQVADAERAHERRFTDYHGGIGSTFQDTLRDAQQERDELRRR